MLSPVSFLRRQLLARPLACFTVAFLSGLIIHGTGSVSLPAAVSVGLFALIAHIILRRFGRRTPVLLLVFALCLGIVRMDMSSETVSADEDRFSVSMTGRIMSDPYIKPETGRLIFEFDLESVDDIPEAGAIRMYLRGEPADFESIEYGQTLSVFGHIWAPDPATNPYEFDFGEYLAGNGMRAYATAKTEDVRILSASHDLRSVIIGARKAISDRIDVLFPKNSGVVKALVIADKTYLSDDIRDSFSKTGITHLICISGMHVSVLAVAMLFVLRRIMTRRGAISIVVVLLVLYGALIGFTSSYVRALIMFIIFSFAPIAGYPSDSVTRLCAAMLLTLTAVPGQINDAGFVLSYSATAGIILLYPPLIKLFCLEEALHKKPPKDRSLRLVRKLVLYFPQLLCATLAAQLATIPAVIAFFGVQPVISVFTNLLCVPLCMLAYPAALVALAFSLISVPLASIIASVPEFMFSALSEIALKSSSLSFTGVRIGRYPALLILVHAALIIASSEISRIRPGIRRFIPLLLIPVACLSSLMAMLGNLGYSVVFLDAGQADCAVIHTEGRVYLVDTGDTYTPAADYLEGTCLRLDGIFLSHPDEDHSGGLAEILSVMKPEVIYLPSGWANISDISSSVSDALSLARDMGVEIIELAAGDELRLSSNTSARIYAPAEDKLTSDSNALSMVLAVDHKGRSVLFTGDLPAADEPELLPNADILKVAHHGSDESTSTRLIEQVSPSIAVISVGENNFGHPSDTVIERLSNANARILRTDLCGAITLSPDKNGQWQIDTYLSPEEKYELE